MERRLARRMAHMTASEIREILKLTRKPGVISFAGGLPAPEFFPVDRMKDVAVRILGEGGRDVLQYSPTEGDFSLRKKIAGRMKMKFGATVGAEEVLITSGSQQGLDLSATKFRWSRTIPTGSCVSKGARCRRSNPSIRRAS